MDTEPPFAVPAYAQLVQHEGYVSCGRFVGEQQVLSCSGDSTCILWDTETKAAKAVFTDHTGDCMWVDADEGKQSFISGSVDGTAKLWDLRQQKHVAQFSGHESDINAVRFLPGSEQFVSAADDSTLRLWDIRSLSQLSKYVDDKIVCGVTSVDVSKSARVIFAGYDSADAIAWDTLTGKRCEKTVMAHDGRVSVVGVNCDGKALATGSWDFFLKIWA